MLLRLKAATFLKDLRLPGTSSFKSQVAQGEPPTFELWCDGAWVWVEKIRGVGAGSVIGIPREACSSIVPLDCTEIRRPDRPTAVDAGQQLGASLAAQNQQHQFNAGLQQQLASAQFAQNQMLQEGLQQSAANLLQSSAQQGAGVSSEPAEPSTEDEDDEPAAAPARRRGGR